MDPAILWTILVAAVLAVVGALSLVGLFLMMRDTARGRGKWGLNYSPPSECPGCGERLPLVRVPTSFRQAMWGGWTCTYCGCELDKWGKVIRPPTRPVEWDDEDEDEWDEPPRRRRRPDDRFRGKSNG
jgi:hypothetical protein